MVETLDFGEDPEGRLFLVMELLEGEPVRAVLAREGRLAPERVVRLLRQLLAGLEAAHAAGIVHRDLKPENLWLDGSGASERLRLLDFGIAKWTGAAPPGPRRRRPGWWWAPPSTSPPSRRWAARWTTGPTSTAPGSWPSCSSPGAIPSTRGTSARLLAAHAYRAVPSPSSLLPELAA